MARTDGRGAIAARATGRRLQSVLLAFLFAAAALCAARPPAAGGAPDGRSAETPPLDARWAFRPLADVEAPRLPRESRARTPIDAFVLRRLHAAGLDFAPPAGRAAAVRRLSLVLLGLPPEPGEVEAFLADSRPDAYERLADRLLASPHYGERWARHWLDLARFAESEGFKSDETRPNAWRWRDYVIRSFNADKPYDRFTAEQIAGDELFPGDPEARLATAFNRHYPDESNARNLRQRRQEILNDITDTTGAVFLGLTFGCARCHDHKFDPITQKDYYRFQAFFAAVRADDHIPLLSDGALQAYRKRRAGWEAATAGIRARMEAIEEPARRSIVKERLEKYPEEIQVAWRKPPEERTPFEWLMYYKAKPYLEPGRGEVAGRIKGEARKEWERLRRELERFADLDPGPLPEGIGMTDAGDFAPPTHVLGGGVYDRPREEVAPGFPEALAPEEPRIEAPPGGRTTGRRTALARWLTDPRNPLPARVMANRIWHWLFGRGIVETPSDFGAMGARPTHPELLDWLAREFVRRGWSVKSLQRLIVTSAVFRQSALKGSPPAGADRDNRLLSYFPRRRLEAEAIRDAALAVSGLLDRRVGGRSVFPELPPGMTARGGWPVSKREADRNRRSLYIFVRRNTRYPLLEVFDFPDTHESCARRHTTTIAPQALALMNSTLALEWAEAFARRVAREAGPQPEEQVKRAFLLAFGRAPAREELELSLAFLERQAKEIARSGNAPQSSALASAAGTAAWSAALADLCHVLLNANEFVYLE